ncbi:DctP family TRAP transporter solute-binding subunit [Peribacillus tepidiphilus]|jgi:tripartite ATP-independent transporter DctP family solute receptor|uniref:DctP family TRAP transporter solute-binding subunit n=1 Tax=Peribacillus tepidiphilus TaxID=2652445 RepID=UPI0035B5631B
MRSFVGFFILTIFGLGAALFIGFESYSSSRGLEYDDEQEGLKEQITLKFSHVVAENTPKGLAAKKFARLVEEYTDYKVKVEIYSNGSLYNDGNEMEALKKNEIQMIAPATSKLTDLSPKWQLLDLPYIFPSHDAIKEALNGEVGKELFDELQGENMKGLAFWTNSFKQITSNTLIKEPKDFKGKTFRIMPSNVLRAQFEHFGASTSVLPFNDTFSHLEKNHLDGQENTISNIYSKKLYQVQKYLTISDHGFLGYAVLVNESFWNKLPKDIQINIEKAMNETTEWLWTSSQELNKLQMEQIEKSSNIEIYRLSTEEKRKWREEMKIIYQDFEEEIGKDLLEKMEKVQRKYQ